MNGKGDAPRPLSVDSKTFASNWDKIFNKKEEICEYSGLPNTESYNAPERSEVDAGQHPGPDEEGDHIKWAPC
jgi:hypothetical protein